MPPPPHTLRGPGGSTLCDGVTGHRELVTAGEDRRLHLWSIEYDWLLGRAALEDAAPALGGGASRAWLRERRNDPLAALDDALDVWRDLNQAHRLAAIAPDPWQTDRGQLLAGVQAAVTYDRVRASTRLATTSLRLAE